jgi:outer membrane protein OmpA-like peptidoglycan-associated protein
MGVSLVKRFVAVVFGVLLTASATAQDAHGPVPPPYDGRPDAPLGAPDAVVPAPGVVSAGVVFDYADAPLVATILDGGVEHRVFLLDNVATFDVGAIVGLRERFALGVTAPVFAAAGGTDGAGGPALGDVHVWAPIALVPLGTAGTQGVAVSAVPYLDLPTGARARDLGDAGFGAGAQFAASLAVSDYSFSAGTGLAWRPKAEYSFGEVKAGAVIPWSLSATWLATETLGIGAEYRARLPLGPGVGLQSDLLAEVRYHADNGLWLVGGGGPGASDGMGSPAWRVIAGVGWSPKRVAAPVFTVGAIAVSVRDPNGEPVRDAAIVVDEVAVARTDASGVALVGRDTRWKRGVTIVASGFLPTPLAEPAEGLRTMDAVVQWAPTPFLLRVVDRAGTVLQPTVTLTGPAESPASTVDPDGRMVWNLAVGTWVVDVTAPGMGHQSREVVVPGGRVAPLYADVILGPDAGGAAELVLGVSDATGVAVEGAEVVVDGQSIGTTSSGGRVVVSALTEGTHDVAVTSDVLTAVERPDVVLKAGQAVPVDIAMAFRQGTVIVMASGPTGAAIDALALFDGPSRLPAAPLGADGRRIFVLRPGDWRLLVSSATLGVQQRDVSVPPESFEPITVNVVLQAAENGDGELVVRATDRDGAPLAGVGITMDGQPLGSTTTGGTLRLQGITPGKRTIAAEGPHLKPTTAAIDVHAGYQESLVLLDWKPGTVEIVARTSDGEPVDALIRLAGPGAPSGGPLGASGHAFFTLEPGRWDVLASSELHGVQTRTVDIAPEQTRRVDIDMVMDPTAGGDATLFVRVTDPDGHPVDGAEIKYAGHSLGSTSTGGTLKASNLPAGTVRVDIASPDYAPLVLDAVRLAHGTVPKTPIEAHLHWAPGSVRLVVVGPQGPVGDAMIRVAGPDVRAPIGVDEAGQRLFALGAGDWSVLVSSPAYGIIERQLHVAADAELRTEEIRFGAAPGDTAVLLVRVVDELGHPVGGASVKVDGADRGVTTKGGAMLVDALAPGAHRLDVSAPDHDPADAVAIDLPGGSTERFVTVHSHPLSVDVVVRDPDGHPVGAVMRFEGPEPMAARHTGADGVLTVDLVPGVWHVFATADKLGVKRQDVTIVAGAKPPRLLFDLEKPRVAVEGGGFVILGQVHFGLDAVKLSPEEDAILTEVANTLRARPDLVRVEVQGHTDSQGGAAYNLTLSQKRAEVVRQALLDRGVAPEQLVARGYGQQFPIADNATEEGRAENRRVEFKILEATAEEIIPEGQ